MSKEKIRVATSMIEQALGLVKEYPALQKHLEKSLKLAQAAKEEVYGDERKRLEKAIEVRNGKKPTYSSLTAELKLKQMEQRSLRAQLNAPGEALEHQGMQSTRAKNKALIQGLESARKKLLEAEVAKRQKEFLAAKGKLVEKTKRSLLRQER